MPRHPSKFTILLLWMLILVLLMTACSGPNPQGAQTPTEQAVHTNTVHPTEEEHVVLDEKNHDGYINNIIVLLLQAGVKDQEVLAWFPGEQASIVGRFPKLNQVQVRIKPRNRQELESLAAELMKKEQVLYAHLDLAASTTEQSQGTPKESNGLDYSKPKDEWWYDVIGLNEAKAYLPQKDLVKVGVVDDGFDTEHPDLNLVFPDKEHKALNQPEEHGTHVAGVIQQILPGHPITVIDSYRIPGVDPVAHIGTLCQFLKPLVDMVEHHVKVINYSMGSDISDDKDMPWAVESSGIASVYIWQLKRLGHDFLIVQSAGNTGIDAYRNGLFCTLNQDNCLGSEQVRRSLGVEDHIKEAQKSVFDSIVVVGAADQKNREGVYPLMEFTNYGEKLDIVAPGMNINSTIPGGYTLMAGTSQAAPIVSGSLALLWSLDKNLSAAQLKDILIQSATEQVVNQSSESVKDPRKTYPMLNLFEAVKKIKKKP